MGSAVRFDAAADRLAITSGVLNYNAAYTWAAWVYISADTNAQVAALSINNNNIANLDADIFGFDTDGTTPGTSVTVANATTTQFSGSFAVGAWHHVAIVRTTNANLNYYLDGTLVNSNTRSAAARAAASRMEIGALTTGNFVRFDGRIAHAKLWSAALSQSEVAAEMAQIKPVRTTNLWGYWPTGPGAGERAKDYSGNGRNWTEGGTLTDEAGPTSVIWGDPLIGSARSSTSVTSLAPTVDQAVPTGQLVVVVLSYRAVGGTPSVTDARGNTYTLDAQASGTNSNRLAIFSAPVTTALQVGDAVTGSFASSNAAMEVLHFSGLDTSGTRVAASNTALGTGTAVSVGATPTATGQVVIAANSRTGNPGDSSFDTDTTDGSWSWIPQVSSGAIQSIEATLDSAVKTVTGTTAQTWNNTLAFSRDWQAAVVVYKVASSGTTHEGTAAATQGLTADAVATATRQGTATATQGLSAQAVATAARIGSAVATQGLTAASDATVTRQGTASATQALTGSVDATVDTVVEGTASATQGLTASADATVTRQGTTSASQGLTAASDATRTQQATASAIQALTAAVDATVSAEGQGSASDTQGLTGAASATVTRQGASSAVQDVTAASVGTVTRQATTAAVQGLTGAASATVGSMGEATASATQGLSAQTIATLSRVGSASGVQDLSAATLASLTMYATATAVQDFIASSAAVPGLPIYGTAATVGYQTSTTTVTSGDGATVAVTSPARATTTVQGST